MKQIRKPLTDTDLILNSFSNYELLSAGAMLKWSIFQNMNHVFKNYWILMLALGK